MQTRRNTLCYRQVKTITDFQSNRNNKNKYLRIDQENQTLI